MNVAQLLCSKQIPTIKLSWRCAPNCVSSPPFERKWATEWSVWWKHSTIEVEDEQWRDEQKNVWAKCQHTDKHLLSVSLDEVTLHRSLQIASTSLPVHVAEALFSAHTHRLLDFVASTSLFLVSFQAGSTRLRHSGTEHTSRHTSSNYFRILSYLCYHLFPSPSPKVRHPFATTKSSLPRWFIELPKRVADLDYLSCQLFQCSTKLVHVLCFDCVC